MTVLELFCGTKSIGKAFKRHGHYVDSVDIEKKFNPDICCDILNFKSDKQYDVIWASPPCTTFSVASMGHHWCGGKGAYVPATKEAIIGLRLMAKTKGIILALKPKLWFIENPRGLMRKFIGINQYRKTVTYCQYGDKRMKPTDIWTNCPTWIPKPMCENGDPCHERAPRGAKTGTQGLKGSVERGIIPEQLCDEIVSSCEKLLTQ